MKQISLNHGKVALVDDDDFEWLSEFHWYASDLGREGQKEQWYVLTCVGGRKNKKTLLMHRLLCPGKRVDHKDRNGLNNQRSNLRPASVTMNNANSEKRSGCSSKFKGVFWEKWTKKWRACIQKAGKCFRLGRFDNEEDAARAYDAAAKLHFGDFSLTNEQLGLYQ